MGDRLHEAAPPGALQTGEPAITDENIFAVPIRVMQWPAAPGFNEALASLLGPHFHERVSDKIAFTRYNLWREFGHVPEVRRLREMFVEGLNGYIDAFLRPEIRQFYDYAMHAWIRIDRPKQVIAPHMHTRTPIVATYYCKTDIADREWSKTGYGDAVREGDLVVLNTFSMFPRQFVKGTRQTHSISPKPGTMVIMPGKLMHWVNPVSEGDERICIANNFDFIAKGEVALPCSFDTGPANP